ncbi:UvrD-like helicase, ATP-binding domain, P-loop containing nucleoside triphosphate hydrolase [Tanacetum coccineum]
MDCMLFFMNITTQKRIWNSLHMHRNLNIIKEVLYSDSKVKEKCNICSFGYDSMVSQKLNPQVLLNLNESQRAAVMFALCKMQCCNISSVEQIWEPPRTGKTMTVSVLLFILFQLKKRFKATGKILVKVSSYSEEIHLEQRVKRLAECLGPVTGWKHCIRSMIDLLENCVCDYYKFLENEFLKEKQLRHENEGKRTMLEMKSFIEYVQERFNSSAPPLKRCINMVSEELEDLFNSKPLQDDIVKSCLSSLRTLQISLEGLTLPCFSNKYAIKQFCFECASFIFCTTSSSYKLHAVNMEPLNIVVIDEAAQLKEAESTIPLLTTGI